MQIVLRCCHCCCFHYHTEYWGLNNFLLSEKHFWRNNSYLSLLVTDFDLVIVFNVFYWSKLLLLFYHHGENFLLCWKCKCISFLQESSECCMIYCQNTDTLIKWVILICQFLARMLQWAKLVNALWIKAIKAPEKQKWGTPKRKNLWKILCLRGVHSSMIASSSRFSP